MTAPQDTPPAQPAGLPHPALERPLQVLLGQTLPQLGRVPTLDAGRSMTAPGHSHLAQGLQFSGIARLNGSLTVAGDWTGQVLSAGSVTLSAVSGNRVTVTESGQLLGQIQAREIAVLGRTSGLLDAGGGRITLHDSAQVRGHLRYGQLMVNGAEIDARLEWVRTGTGDADDPSRGP